MKGKVSSGPRPPGAPCSAVWYVGLGVLRSYFSPRRPKKQKPRTPVSGVYIPKLVAGVRFELTTFGL